MSSQIATGRSTDAATVSDEVVSAVAAEKEVDPLALDPLYQVIDPDAIDALYGLGSVGQGSSSVRVEFTYCGCDVVVDADGSVTVSSAT